MSSCFKSSLPVIDIHIDDEIKWTQKEQCTIHYTFGNKVIELPARIKARGGMSSKYYKHSYSLELNKKFALGGLPKDDDWILNANYIDKTFMRHKLSYDLFSQMSHKNIAPKCSFITLRKNDKNLGIYVLMEEVNGGLAGIEKSDSMAMIFKDPPVFIKEDLVYLQDSANYYQQKFPAIENDDRTAYMDRFRDFLFNSEDSVFATQIENWIDVESFIDWHIMLMLTNNGDGIKKNFYLYKINSATPLRIAIWDYDHSFGRDGDNEHNMLDRIVNPETCILLNRLMNIPGTSYNEKLKKRWREFRQSGIISERNIFRLVNKNDRILRNNVDENFKIWPINGKWYYDDASYQEEVELIKEFIKIRIPQLDEELR